MPEQNEYLTVLKAVYKKAAVDAEFRTLCLKDAASAIREVSDLELTDKVKIRFTEKLEEQVFLLPPLGATELSDTDLENLAAASGVLKNTFHSDCFTDYC